MIHQREIVFRTRFFEVEAKHAEGEAEPYYSLKLPDYVCVVAYERSGRIVCVRQYRPALETETLELPSGLVDNATHSPEETARRELEEETGYLANDLVHLGTLYSDVGRLQNRLWCYLARDVRAKAGWAPEKGIEPVLLSAEELDQNIRDGTFNHALHLAALELARHSGGRR